MSVFPTLLADIAVPATSANAIAEFHRLEMIWALNQLAALVLPLVLLFTGLGVRMRNVCARLAGGRRVITLILFATLYLVLAASISGAIDYQRDAPSALAPWLLGELGPLIARVVTAALFLWIPFALMRRFPRAWWALAAGALLPVAFLVLVALPVVVDPISTHYEPLRDRTLSATIAGLAARCGVSDIPVFIGGDDDTAVGLGPTKRIFLEDGIQKRLTNGQIVFTVSHELKHYVMGDNWKALAIIGAVLFSGLFLVDFVGRRAAASGRFGFIDIADPAALPLHIFVLTLFGLCILPAFNWEARHIEFEADRFGLELSHQNQAAATLFAGWITKDGAVADYDLFFKLFRQTHPSLAERIRFANTYRPWEKNEPLVYGSVCRAARWGSAFAGTRHARVGAAYFRPRSSTNETCMTPTGLMVIRYVHDMDRAVAFHRDGLGLTLVNRSPGWSQLSCGDAFVGLHLIYKGVTETPVAFAGLNLRVADLESAVAKAQSCGAELVAIREAEPRVPVRLAVMIDADGNGFELRQEV
jgi:Zn-dependent protease with chaperone function/catechol 2,3-dioxygenase-like lactoylglutathione lyase family enzyme